MTVPCAPFAQTLFPATSGFLDRETTTGKQGMAGVAPVSVVSSPFMQVKAIRPRSVSGTATGAFQG